MSKEPGKYTTIKIPTYDLECRPFGSDIVVLRFEKGEVRPNAFHRLMQSLVFGHKWSKRASIIPDRNYEKVERS